MSRRALSLAIRLTVSLGLLALLGLVVAEPRELASRLSAIRAPMLAAAFVLTAGDRVLMAFKWWVLLRARGEAIRHAKQGRIHTFVSTSPIHLAHQRKKTEEQVLEIITGTVA